MLKKATLLLLGATASCFAAEHATYDAAGSLTSLISNGLEIPVHGQFMVTFTGAPAVTVQPADQRSPITREGLARKWEGNVSFPRTAPTRRWPWAGTRTDARAVLDGTLTAKSLFPGPSTLKFLLDVASVDSLSSPAP